MALTDSCNVFASFGEDGINRVARHIMLQRPSLFNYGTDLFVAHPELLCRRIEYHPEVVRRGNPLITLEDPLPIPGTGSLYGLHFCAQLTQLQIDLHKGNQFALPPELDPLPHQSLALHAEVCAGIACPHAEIADGIGDSFDYPPVQLPGQKHGDRKDPKRDQDRPPIQPVPPGRKIECFCLSLFAVAHIEILNPSTGSVLAIRLDGLEIVDIAPSGLETAIECYVATTIRIGILPRIRVALDTMVFELGKFGSLSVSPTPISVDVPNNPAIEDDQTKVFVNVAVV